MVEGRSSPDCSNPEQPDVVPLTAHNEEVSERIIRRWNRLHRAEGRSSPDCSNPVKPPVVPRTAYYEDESESNSSVPASDGILFNRAAHDGYFTKLLDSLDLGCAAAFLESLSAFANGGGHWNSSMGTLC